VPLLAHSGNKALISRDYGPNKVNFGTVHLKAGQNRQKADGAEYINTVSEFEYNLW
jgi:hypothetical protein